MVTGVGTSGGGVRTSGGRRRLALILAVGFLIVLTAITIGNAESLISDFQAAGVHETRTHVWIWELTSIAAWLSTTPAIWWAVARVRSPRFGWPVVAAIAAAGLCLCSAWHIGGMIALRHIVYAAMGEHYRFEGGLADPFLYEFRKDVATYLQFVALAALAQWLLDRVGGETALAEATSPPPEPPRAITVTDGTTRHLVPIDAIAHIAAAGNYVEVHADGRALLHRATLAGMEEELGAGFVRIHRSRLVARAAIRRIETDRSGDFSVELADGTMLSGSRRYRERLQ